MATNGHDADGPQERTLSKARSVGDARYPELTWQTSYFCNFEIYIY